MKKLPLTQGQWAWVDDKWYAYLMQWKWAAQWNNKSQTFYAAKQGAIMHRVIMQVTDDSLVDHIDHIGTHNWETNLRMSTSAQQAMNRRKLSGTSSQYKGVSWNKARKRWHAYITHNQKIFHLGVFTHEIEAALAYDRAAKELFGEYAFLNFR